MTDKKQLEEIKEKYSKANIIEHLNGIDIIAVAKEDIAWLIQQAEKREYWMKQHRKRCNELEGAYFKIQLLEKRLDWLIRTVERYEEALEDISKVGWSGTFGGGFSYTGENHAECVKIASEALEGEFNE